MARPITGRSLFISPGCTVLNVCVCVGEGHLYISEKGRLILNLIPFLTCQISPSHHFLITDWPVLSYPLPRILRRQLKTT